MVSVAPLLVHCPYSGTWSLRQPRPPLHKPSDGFTPNSSPLLIVHLRPLPRSDLQSLSFCTQALSTLVATYLRLGSAE